ncbi:MAG TPA: NADH:flavin oxidoreductase/NADH oxidase [Stellaceae bacterium]|nr:NADH:flavin oxidoreductase/NADH oxidase [Stellaceae bacterium]
MSSLFEPLTLRSVTLANRVVVSPMCQYSAEDGSANDWHLAHLGQLALSGAGLLITEATHVSAVGRITPHCLGLYSDANEAALGRVLRFMRQHGSGAIGVQLAHAGRKAASSVPWEGGGPLSDGAWPVVGASPIAFAPGWHVPRELDADGLAEVKAEFVAAAQRADRLGIDVIELHGAHGYLLHSFLSPLSNRRGDGYGGSRANRMRFPLEVFEAVRTVFPADKPVGIRISASDHVEGGWSLDDSIALAHELKSLGADFIDVSSGGMSPDQKITVGPGYQVAYAGAIRRETGLVSMAVGMIDQPHQAETIIRDGSADLVALARGFLRNPRWVWDAADALGAEAHAPPQYARVRPSSRSTAPSRR